MKIKHYRAADMRQALRQVREAQGPDAVILSSRRLANGVEVVAAVDYDVDMPDASIAEEAARTESRIPTAADYAALAPRKAAVKSLATCRARSKSCGSNEIADTLGCPPPPYFSASDARF